ncbi:MAG: DoxX family protein [Pseudonocardia sp.]|nr:DoxX family protein [Pseudonocardia sp.]
MTSLRQTPSRARSWPALLYWPVTGLFFLIFGFSAVWTFVDPVGAAVDTAALGFPAFFAVPLAVAKLLGLAVIALRRWPVLTGLAFAGFLYDVVLALSAHLAQSDVSRGSLAALGIVSTVAAFAVHRRRFGAAR